MIQVWALRQEKKTRRQFLEGDNYVSFKTHDKSSSGERYYYIYSEQKFLDLLSNIKGVTIDKYIWEKGNWIAILRKK